MPTKKAAQHDDSKFTREDLERALRKHVSDELLRSIDALVVEEDAEQGKQRSYSEEWVDPLVAVVHTEGETRFFWIGAIRHPRHSKKLLTIGGIFAATMGGLYHYLQNHSDQLVVILHTILGSN